MTQPAGAACRILDTRHAIGVPTTTPVPAGGTFQLNVSGVDGLPSSGLGAVVLNVTVTDTRASGTLTAFTSTLAGGVYQPTTANMSWRAGQTIAHLTTVGVNLGGPIVLHSTSAGSVDIVTDLTGWYTNDGRAAAQPGPTYVPVAPVRVLDTRRGVGVNSHGPLPPNSTASGRGGRPHRPLRQLRLDAQRRDQPRRRSGGVRRLRL